MLASLVTIFSRLHFRQLRLLIALGDRGSLLKAADHVGLTQPGASKALREMEEALGVTLFTRTNRGLVPNDIGECAIRYARLIETDVARLRDEITGILQGHGGRLAVGAIMGAVPLLTDTLAQLLKEQPHVSVEIVESTSRELLRLLDEGRIDVAICRTTISPRPDLYDSTAIRDETLAVVAGVDHPMAGKKSIELCDLSPFRWVVYSANMPMRLLLEREYHQSGLRFPSYIIETMSAFTTLSLLQKDLAIIALVSSDVARFCTKFGMTTVLPLRLHSTSEPYELVTRRGSTLSPTAQIFVAQLKSVMAPAAGLP